MLLLLKRLKSLIDHLRHDPSSYAGVLVVNIILHALFHAFNSFSCYEFLILIGASLYPPLKSVSPPLYFEWTWF
jgi:hypothetical protein